VAVRLREFFARLGRHEAFTSFEDAYLGLIATIEAVEDELTGIPNKPETWKTDGRLYPPERDHWFAVPSYPDVTRMRTKGHNVFISANGALEIQVAGTRAVIFSKAGADGRKVWGDG
jgi:hypothetical protein